MTEYAYAVVLRRQGGKLTDAIIVNKAGDEVIGLPLMGIELAEDAHTPGIVKLVIDGRRVKFEG